jgi:hypothetical protein
MFLPFGPSVFVAQNRTALTTRSNVDRKSSQAPLNSLQHLAACNCGRPLQCNPAWSFSSLRLSFGSAIRSIHRIFCICYRKALHLHFASSYSVTLAVITNIKRHYLYCNVFYLCTSTYICVVLCIQWNLGSRTPLFKNKFSEQ